MNLTEWPLWLLSVVLCGGGLLVLGILSFVGSRLHLFEFVDLFVNLFQGRGDDSSGREKELSEVPKPAEIRKRLRKKVAANDFDKLFDEKMADHEVPEPDHLGANSDLLPGNQTRQKHPEYVKKNR